MRLTRLLAVAAVLAGTALGTAACEEPAPKATTSATPTPPPAAKRAPQPAAGACYHLAYKAALAATTNARAVPCRQVHTTQTYFVGPASTTTSTGHLLSIDSEKVRAQMARECPQRFASYVGGSPEQRRLSMLSSIWFGPTLDQSDAGQSWIRCDAIAVSSEGHLARLTGSLKKALDSPGGRDRWGRCATAKPGTKGAHQVICSARSSWRAVATLDVKAGAQGAFPGPKAAGNAGSACEDRVRALADDKLSFTWGWTPPTRAQWRTGQHYGFCWAPKGQ